jgi:hypothetical protein
MTAMTAKSYTLKRATHVENSYLGERFEFDFKAGKHTPASESEELALALAVEAEEAAARAEAVGADEAVTPAESEDEGEA